ncbi:MAG TPA: DUF983 domain-containing protein [Alphaproteobacteria bacterium]|nr:DUF983 domain-containing protein [Alphaproteobacteria bacterium]
MTDASGLSVSPFAAGLRCRCPRCGQGALYDGLLTVRERCTACGLDLRAQDSGDGPAVFVILVLGGIVVGLALLVEVKFSPPLWVHAVLWPGVILAGAIALLRMFKATLIALQFRHRAAGTDAL